MLLDGTLGESETDLLRHIRAQSGYLFHLLRDLMTLSELNTGRIALDIDTVDVGHVLGALHRLVDELGRDGNVGVTWEVDENLPRLRTDAQRLEQILQSLVVNAFKFTTRGNIDLRVRHDAAHARVIFEVADTGVGIPAEAMPHIFDEFRQVDGSMSRTYGGIGLGLALVRKLTLLLEGDITVASEIQRGSTFRVAIPVDPL